MHKLFKKHYEVFFQRAFRLKDEGVDKLHTEISRFKRNKDFKDGEILHRFPKKELRHFVRSECPTERLPGKKEIKSYEVIKATKRLRNFLNIPEHFTCSRCSKRETCKFRDIIPPSKNTSVSDLLIMLNGFHNYESVVYKDKNTKEQEGAEGQEGLEGIGEEDVGAVARKELLAELKEAGEEEFLEEDEEEIEGSEGEEGEEALDGEQEQAEVELQDRYSHKVWDSALKLVDPLYPIIEDINYRKGSGCKQYINTYISENKKLVADKRQELEESGDEEGEVSQVPRYQGRNQRNRENYVDRRAQKGNFQKEAENQTWGTKPNRRGPPASQERNARPARRYQEEEEGEIEEEMVEEEEFDQEKDEFAVQKRGPQKRFDNRGQNRGDRSERSYRSDRGDRGNSGYRGDRGDRNERGDRGNRGDREYRARSQEFFQNKPERQFESNRKETVKDRRDGRDGKFDNRNRQDDRQPYKGNRNADRGYQGNKKSFRERENSQSDVRDKDRRGQSYEGGNRGKKYGGNQNRSAKGRGEGNMNIASFMQDIKV